MHKAAFIEAPRYNMLCSHFHLFVIYAKFYRQTGGKMCGWAYVHVLSVVGITIADGIQLRINTNIPLTMSGIRLTSDHHTIERLSSKKKNNRNACNLIWKFREKSVAVAASEVAHGSVALYNTPAATRQFSLFSQCIRTS